VSCGGAGKVVARAINGTDSFRISVLGENPSSCHNAFVFSVGALYRFRLAARKYINDEAHTKTYQLWTERGPRSGVLINQDKRNPAFG
jgi:hypothetical protein